MYKFLVALFLLYVPASMSALFLPQADGSGRPYHPGLPQGKSSKAFFRLPLRAGQSRAIAAALKNEIHALIRLQQSPPPNGARRLAIPLGVESAA